MDVAERVRALRERVGLNQTEVAARAGLERIEVNQIERGKNSCSTWRIREGLARAFGLPIVMLADYIDEKIDLETLMIRAKRGDHAVDDVAQPTLSERPEWSSTLAAAKTAAVISDPDLTDEDWARVGHLHDGPALPKTLTPRLILQLARALRLA